ncbi:sugar ABC transporter ATP-binding protein [Paraburkholderia youngii]|uniref:Ribose transport system ATP-binding protein/rhamnose transport system ATP-binding protein n=1 Tax=Paraburkholderia youngii TaxID=2782701 RepID=A0A7W8L255_9BURK|nr:sugar ABC transporter ATP-binding protein [Paraburkholderia youngii]MBB5399067.1 ribose transport system ATP-binding protein/rhamnose transport system ATP-binding protein [Paraburkholderia youngii]
MLQDAKNGADTHAVPSLLCARNLTKHYGGVKALTGVSLELAPGEIHALCGENGAGKSTFIKILGGLVQPDDGEITVDGHQLKLGHRTDPKLISIVHQELAIVPTLSVLDNILLGGADQSEIYRRSQYRDSVREHLDSVGLSHVKLDAPASRLSLAECQLVEIARGMSRHAKVLLLDEPTATLSDAEIVRVFEVARRLRDQGTAMIFVSHRLDEVFALTDRITVFRNGQHVLTQRTADMTTADVVKAMIGRELVHNQVKPTESRANVTPRLSIDNLSVADKVKDLSLAVAPGEILAVVGQLGSGAEVVVEALAGLRGDISNSVKLDGQQVKLDGIRSSLRAGIGYVAEDRADKGVFLDAPIAINITSSVMVKFSRAGVMRRTGEQEEALRLASMFTIDPKRLPHEVSTLSGGNQQKVSLAKAVALSPRLLLLNEPTRGVDIGARSEIYATLRKMADDGLSIVFYSTDLEEILELADTVLTVFRGRMVRHKPRFEIDGDTLLHDIVAGGGDASHGHVSFRNHHVEVGNA